LKEKILNLKKIRGQYFTTNKELKDKVFKLVKNNGRSLEPSTGIGSLCSYFKENGKNTDIALEIDKNLPFIYQDIKIMNFFDYSTNEKFDTIYGNPPYVKQQLIESKEKINSNYKSLNLYLYFIEKSFYHLNSHGEMIFIIPREFLTNSRADKIRELLYKNGTITNIIDYQEKKMFNDADPYVIIFRYEKDNFTHKTIYSINEKNEIKNEIFKDGFIKFLDCENNITLDNFFDIKVGIVSGANEIFQSDIYGNIEVLCSDFLKTNKKKKYIFYQKEIPENVKAYLLKYKEKLINRKIKKFNEENWFEWGAVRNLNSMMLKGECIYVNSKTRNKKPFFKEKIDYFDGSLLALIPKKEINIDEWLYVLNNSEEEFKKQGFIVGNKYQFTQKSLSKFIINDFVFYKKGDL